MFNTKLILVASIWLSAFLSLAQNNPYFIIDQNLVNVKSKTGNDLTLAFSGGFKSPMFSEIDANNDGINDLFVFDRFDRSISIFLYINNEYVYAPEYEYYFPPLTGWVLLRDFNCDGKNDIFAANFSGIQVWENTTTGSRPQFTQVTNGLLSTDGPILVLPGDIPAIDDIDGDGDLDILAFNSSSTNAVYYRNDAGGCDLNFSVYTQCWGHFAESGLNSDIVLGDSCGGNKPSNNDNEMHSAIMHQGSTFTTFDYDNDGDKDLLIGDISNKNVKLLINGGTSEDALITQVVDKYPITNPIDIFIWSSVFMIDVDHDGDKDMIASTAEISMTGATNYNNTWYYENTSNNNTPNYTFRQKNFLADLAIEVGSGASPHFYDFDHDGDMDLLIGSFIEKIDPFTTTAKLYLYENIGDSSQAIFRLLDDDFASLTDSNFNGISPTTGDLDNDGDIDLLLGTNDGDLIYYENIAPIGEFPQFSAPVYRYKGIDVGFASAPLLIDFDRDNDLDLIIGEGNGNLNYFENIGNANTPNFKMITDSLGKVSVQNSQFPSGYGYSTPYITQLDSNNNYDLVVGSWDGLIKVFMNIEDYGINEEYPSITNTYFNLEAEIYTDLNFNIRTAPALTDLDGDGLNDMIVGVFRGGALLLKNNSDTALIPNTISERVNQNINIYPNPSNGLINVSLNNNTIKSIQIFNAQGVIIHQTTNINTSTYKVNLKEKSQGLYIISVLDNKNQLNYQKIIFE